jgi:hypothetical protein
MRKQNQKKIDKAPDLGADSPVSITKQGNVYIMQSLDGWTVSNTAPKIAVGGRANLHPPPVVENPNMVVPASMAEYVKIASQIEGKYSVFMPKDGNKGPFINHDTTRE